MHLERVSAVKSVAWQARFLLHQCAFPSVCFRKRIMMG
jgi:hypothetical protein